MVALRDNYEKYELAAIKGDLKTLLELDTQDLENLAYATATILNVKAIQDRSAEEITGSMVDMFKGFGDMAKDLRKEFDKEKEAKDGD